MSRYPVHLLFLASIAAIPVSAASAAPFSFSTGVPDGLIATASRPAGISLETETADDFVLGRDTRLAGGSFTGLLPSGFTGSVGNVVVEIYRVFPLDSTFPPSANVPTRVNSPSDIALLSRDASLGELSFATTTLSTSFTAANSVVNGIHPVPGVFTGGEGAVTGQEVSFSFTFTAPLGLAAGHYFFVPQVDLGRDDFLWLSASKPIVAPGTPFIPDLQSWIRNEGLAPDWLRIGTDITHQGPFNAAFSLTGATVPEPATWALMIAGFAMVGAAVRRRRPAAAIAVTPLD